MSTATAAPTTASARSCSLAGGAVNGGKVFGDWPGLAQSQLYEKSDLKPTTDIRSIFKGMLKDHIGVPTTLLNSTIFPDSASAPPMANLVKTSTAAASAEALPLASFTPAPLRSEPPIARYRRGVAVTQARAL